MGIFIFEVTDDSGLADLTATWPRARRASMRLAPKIALQLSACSRRLKS
jgi:hypothetical protein